MPQQNGADMVLYFHPFSFCSQKVVMAMKQKHLKFRPMFVDIPRGRQYNDRFLTLNPRGEVPVLVDDFRVIPDSEHIINYLEDNFSNGTPRLRPLDHDLRQRVDQLHRSINDLKVEVLTLGSLFHDDLIDLNAKAPFDNIVYKAQLKVLAEQKEALLEREIVNHPAYAEALRKKKEEFIQERTLWQSREKYQKIILDFERVMDECEAELQSHTDNRWWLCSPDISIADVSFSIILHRLWQLGFERQMWEHRPYVKCYFSRVQLLDSFREATTMKEVNGFVELITSPAFWGVVVALAIAGGGWYYWNKYTAGSSNSQEIMAPIRIPVDRVRGVAGTDPRSTLFPHRAVSNPYNGASSDFKPSLLN